jgi:ribosomal protein L12E/L44/L45/RPP1/RPP2
LPDLAPSDLTGEQAGATIRSLAEVEAVLGDKLEGTLHEVETTTLNADGAIIKQSVKGTLTVNNPSADDRIYDIDVLLDNIESTDIGGEHVSVDELEPSKNHTMAYKVNGKQMMTLRERLDTNPSRDQERSLSVAIGEDPGAISMELEVENLSGVDLHDVVVTRPIPEEMHFETAGGADLDEGALTWTVGRLPAGNKQTLSLQGTISVASTKAIKAGKATASYRADATLSSMTFRELDAFCRGFTYMKVREDERPDNWKCQAIFENRSSFAVDLTKLQVRMKGSDELLFDIHDVDQDVSPNGKWESDERVVMAQSEPDFTYDLSYTVLPRAVQSTEGSMTLEEKKLEVLEADVEKSYSNTNLRSYRSQKLTSTLTLTNKGSAVINLMRITDDVPGLFEVPHAEQLSIKLDGKAIDDDQFKVEVSEGVTIEKEHRSPDGNGHTMTMTVGTRGPLGLKPGKSIEITYPLTAPDPSPGNERVDAPARIEFSAERFGPICSKEPETAPSVKVVHNRRNFSAGKQAIPLGGKGRYEVLILFENNGDTALSDLYINDVLPPQFEIKEWEMKSANGKRDDVTMTSEEGEGGLHIVWHVPKVEKGERLEVSFDIKGSGVVDAEALNRFHGVHFGDEIESDDLPPVEEAADADAPASDADDAETVNEEGESTPDEDEAEDSGPKMKFREDMLLKVMESAGIDVDHRDEFVAFAADYDHDDNGYLKKSELEDAAAAWNARDAGDAGEAEADSETDAAQEEDTEAADEGNDESGEKACMICSTANAHDATVCAACGYTFES